MPNCSYKFIWGACISLLYQITFIHLFIKGMSHFHCKNVFFQCNIFFMFSINSYRYFLTQFGNLCFNYDIYSIYYLMELCLGWNLWNNSWFSICIIYYLGDFFPSFMLSFLHIIWLTIYSFIYFHCNYCICPWFTGIYDKLVFFHLEKIEMILEQFNTIYLPFVFFCCLT